MSSKSLQIRDAVLALLRASPCGGVAAADIHDDPSRPMVLAAAQIVVELGDEPPPTSTLDGIASREVELDVSIVSAGASPQTVADAPLVAAHARIMAAPTLGGLSMGITEGGRERVRDVLDKPVGRVRTTYIVQYTTTTASLET